ncbi:DUF480 domain-containing protein [Endozoicomonas sp. OPT23]|uniref:YceH family protein n=1 Tax=Endozoicomonas sp. OPT23 TaxID=2072845 RepID=UPI00129AE878|nr:DUF480 domain-containing protein [Endozoicomonas sp. OPT23]MRI33669.1 DUF480 domain-containing protein [Endozoicomonas sp. OPT23]
MDMSLTNNQCRVIGCLLEKESTTPDQYPLSLNSLVSACNQKSNRDPVMALTEQEVLDTVQSLLSQRLVSEEPGSRVSRFRHRFCNTEFSQLQLSREQSALICCFLLRGAQTPGELRGRTARMAGFSDVQSVDAELKALSDQGMVKELPRQAGKREVRYMHLLGDSTSFPDTEAVLSDNRNADQARIAELEHQVKVLEAEVNRLTGLLSDRD